jgi:hypothetical protein
MHGQSLATGLALAGLIVAVLALVFQVLAYRRDK